MHPYSHPNVREYVRTTGTGSIVLQGAVPGFRRVSQQYQTNDTFHYRIDHLSANEYEEGTATFTDPNTIARASITASSNGGSAVNFSAGEKVFTAIPRLIAPTYSGDPSGLFTGEVVNSNGTPKMYDGSTLVTMSGGGSTEESVSYQYRVAASVAPANITWGDWRDVPLATEVGSGITGASIASNVVTLPAGTYEFEYFTNAYFGAVTSATVSAQCRLYNSTATAEITDSGGSLGTVRENDDLTIAGMASSRGSVAVTFGVETDVILQIQADDNAAYGATSTWASQLCAELRIRKTA